MNPDSYRPTDVIVANRYRNAVHNCGGEEQAAMDAYRQVVYLEEALSREQTTTKGLMALLKREKRLSTYWQSVCFVGIPVAIALAYWVALFWD